MSRGISSLPSVTSPDSRPLGQLVRRLKRLASAIQLRPWPPHFSSLSGGLNRRQAWTFFLCGAEVWFQRVTRECAQAAARRAVPQMGAMTAELTTESDFVTTLAWRQRQPF